MATVKNGSVPKVLESHSRHSGKVKGSDFQSVEEDVKRIIAGIAKTDPNDLRLDTDLRSDLAVDSLMGLQIVAAIESRFDFRVDDDELDAYRTVREIVETVQRHCGTGDRTEGD